MNYLSLGVTLVLDLIKVTSGYPVLNVSSVKEQDGIKVFRELRQMYLSNT